jgi:hypothetical protein
VKKEEQKNASDKKNGFCFANMQSGMKSTMIFWKLKEKMDLFWENRKISNK